MAKAGKAKRGKKTKSRARRIWGRIGVTFLVMFIVLGLVSFVPAISLALPTLLYR